jgi:hypothetical protein
VPSGGVGRLYDQVLVPPASFQVSTPLVSTKALPSQ